MFDMFVGFIIFCLVLFIYVHIQFQLKTASGTEMYELNYQTKNELEYVCDLKRPAIIHQMHCDDICRISNATVLFSQYGAFELMQRPALTSALHVSIPVSTIQLNANTNTNNTNTNQLFENNSDFLIETGIQSQLAMLDLAFRPYMVASCRYDVWIGQGKVETPLRYEVSYRTYLILTEGNATLFLTPPNNSKYLNAVEDYEYFEFRTVAGSNNNPKIKWIEVPMCIGTPIYIPAYWWYRIVMNESSEPKTNKTSISVFQYKTYMNILSILPAIGKHILQLQNIRIHPSTLVQAETCIGAKEHEEEQPDPPLNKPVEPEENPSVVK
jgi:hypothetical protein